jgi:hypothetical protein
MRSCLGETVSKLFKKYLISADCSKDEVRDIKLRCLSNPETFLWTTTTKRLPQAALIFRHIQSLNYEDKPDYEYIRSQLL